ncbi:S-layer homology domain-containing protein [Ructibacterium gallinarum]|uniref:S-layer homology domain-containing protein n=1 Tax=Ructibacterium gallinarum TaxID=2779355 RepID=A0A9D5R929_9FIRM|nr:S-layer homology domain-containing protein [Ructibacterium gallinarum]MBE5041021.1 S-layer homology domain-containing protein [Ructibacterium gallinarum]
MVRIYKRFLGCLVIVLFLIGMSILGNVLTVFAAGIFVDEFSSANSTKASLAFASDNVREVNSSNIYFGDSTRLTRLRADSDGYVIYKAEDISYIFVNSITHTSRVKNGPQYSYSCDNQSWTEIEPFYKYNKGYVDNNNYVVYDNYFKGFPSGTIYFRILIPQDAENGVMEYDMNFGSVKIESNGASLLDGVEEDVRIFALSEDEQVMKTTEASPYTEELRLLCGLGIFEANLLNSSENLNVRVTRGEFAKMLVELSGFSNIGFEKKAQFSDVPVSDEISESIAVVTSLNYMSGMQDGSFRPHQEVSYETALRAVLKILGYEAVIVNNDIYDLSRKLDIDLDKQKDDTITVEEMGRFLFRVIKAKPAVMSDVDSYRPDSIDYMTKRWNLVRKQGQITATRYGNITTNPAPEYDEVTVGLKQYQVMSNSLQEMLGEYIYYYAIEQDTENRIIAWWTNSSQARADIETEDICKLSEDCKQLSYYLDNGKTKNLALSDVVLIKNGERLSSFTVNDILDSEQLTITDRDQDGVLDTILVWKSKEYVVQSVATSSFMLTDQISGETLEVDPEDSERINYFLNDNMATIDSISKDCVLSIYMGNEKQYVSIYINNTTSRGIVNEINMNDGEVRVDGITHPLSKQLQTKIETGAVSEMRTGDTYLLYMNYRGEIAWFRTDGAASRYAYMMRAQLESGLDESILISVLDADGTIRECKTETRISVFIGNNGKKYTSREAFEILKNNCDNVKEDLVEGIIKYRMNSSGRITAIYLPVLDSQSEDEFSLVLDNSLNDKDDAGNMVEVSKRYISYVNAAGNSADIINDKYIFNEAQLFVVPFDRELADYRTTYSFARGDYRSGQPKYHLHLFDMNSNYSVGAVVIYESEVPESNKDVMYTSLVTVQNVVKLYDEASEEVKPALEIVDRTGTANTYKINENLKQSSNNINGRRVLIEELNAGDVLQIGLNTENELIKFNVIYKNNLDWLYGASGGGTACSTYSEYYFLYGTVKINNAPYLLIEGNGYEKMLKVTSAKFTIYDIDSQSIEAASINDLYPGDKVIVRSQRTTAQDVVIIRNS